MEHVGVAYPREVGTSVLAATVAAAAMIAQQVMGKATRDAMFLSHYPVARLPYAIIAGAIVSGVVVLLMTRLIRRWGPGRVVPVAFTLHAAVMVAEWAFALRFESVVALVLYVHTASVGATIVSAFWSVVSESFDPHTAKQVVGRIGAGAALGGVIGGGLAWLASQLTSLSTMLLAMAGLSLVCAAGVRALGKSARGDRASPVPEADAVASSLSGIGVLRQTPYLRMLALLVLFAAITQALLDYLLSAHATDVYGHGVRLLSFFAIFQTSIGVISFLLQLSVNRLALERLGVGATIALMPTGVVALGAVALAAPSLVTVALQRATEGVLSASLFRSAYEVLFTPLPQAQKRPTKTAIDVVFDRLGMMAGSALTLGILAWSTNGGLRAVTAAATLAAVAQLVIAQRLHQGYVRTLADRLQAGAVELDSRNVHDATTLATISRTVDGLDRRKLLAQIEVLRSHQGDPDRGLEQLPEFPELDAMASDERLHLLRDLRSQHLETVVRALHSESARLAPHVPELLEMLGRDELAGEAARALRPLVPRHIGAIVDVVLDGSRPVVTRRRAARLLGNVWSQRAADALVFALDATELEVRHIAGRVLAGMRERNPALHFDSTAAIARAHRELESPAAFDVRRLEHTFNVLSLTFPREPMQLAYAALTADDPYLRGVALEYLDATLPADLREALALHVEVAPPAPTPPRPAVPSQKAPGPLEFLLQSRDALRLSIDELRRRSDSSTDLGR
jgi:hypothetical protein